MSLLWTKFFASGNLNKSCISAQFTCELAFWIVGTAQELSVSFQGYNFAVNCLIKKCIILHKCLDIQKKIYTFASNV